MRSALCASLFLLALASAAMADEPLEFQRTPPPKALPAALDGAATPPVEAEAPDGAVDDPYMEQVRQLMREEAEAAEAEADGSAGADAGSLGGRAEDGPTTASAIIRGLMALCATLALILLILAALKRWGRRTPLLAGHALGSILGRIALSPQATLHFVRVKDEVLLVGVTQHSVTLLRSLDAELFDEVASPEPVRAAGDPPAADFLSQLQASQLRLQEDNTAGFDEELDNLKGELQRLKQYFQESSRARE